MSSFQMTVGLLFRKQFREYLEREKFMGKKIEWLEHKSLLSSIFTVTGMMYDLEPIMRDCQEFEALVNKAAA